MQIFAGYQLPALLKASGEGAVLILLILAAQRAFRRRLSPRWRYALWLLVVVRLALLCTIPSPASLFNLLNLGPDAEWADGARAARSGQVPAVAQPASDELTEPSTEAASLLSAAATPRLGRRLSWLVGLWSAGALTLVVYLLVTHCRLARGVALRRPLIDAQVLNLLEDCKQQMGVRVPVTLIESGEAGSPALWGFVRPRLLLPAGLARNFSLEELRYVFLHELGHVKRHDILMGWVMTGLQILHWFNPLVWLAFGRMRADRELACDALALSYARAEENQPYGRTIIKLLESFGHSAWAPSLAGIVESSSQIKERISMIATFNKTNRGLALTLALFAGLGLITLTDAQPGVAPLANDLIGTWILAGRPGEVGEVPAVGGRLKFLTGTHWCDTQADPKTGAVMFHHGGTYTLKGNEYTQTTDYANETTASFIGKTAKFTIKVEGDTLTLIGIGNPWREVWKRAAPQRPRKSDAVSLQGTWNGQEVGASDQGTSRMVIRGSSLDFHGANSNEWYKANFTLYDTAPKQLVVAITDCPAPEYVGRTAYAIYEIKDGTLTVAGNEPGNPVAPASFDAPGARKFVFKQK